MATSSNVTEAQAAEQLLADIGAPASSASDARVLFLVGQEDVEGLFTGSDPTNPWATSMPESGSTTLPGNPDGVAVYPSLGAGEEATIQTLEQSYDAPYLQGLENPSSSESSLESALAASNWEGGGGGSSANQQYAEAVASDYGENANATPSTDANLALTLPGGVLDPLNLITGSTESSLASDVGTYILKGVLTLAFGALFVYGAILTTKRSGKGGAAKQPDELSITQTPAQVVDESGEPDPWDADLAEGAGEGGGAAGGLGELADVGAMAAA